MMSDEDFEELIDVKDAIEDLLFHAAVSSQIDADDARDHDEIELDEADATVWVNERWRE